MSVSGIGANAPYYPPRETNTGTSGQSSSAAAATTPATSGSPGSAEYQPILYGAVDASFAPDLGKAIEAATKVDPVTGHRELIAGAGTKLGQTVSALLLQNGYTADEARSVVKSLTDALSKGTPLSISLEQDLQQGSLTSSSSSDGSSQGASLYARQVKNTLNIDVNLDDGSFSVSVGTQSALLAADGSGTTINQSGLTDTFEEGSTTDSSLANPLSNLVSELQQPTGSPDKNVSNLIKALRLISHGQNQETRAATAGTSTDAGVSVSKDGKVASGSFSITSLLAIQQSDGGGYGTTLYQRPDGSLGNYTTKPHDVTA